jgi:hypothetical protein
VWLHKGDEMQSIRKRGGRSEARGAQSRIQSSKMAERIIQGIDNPRRFQPRQPNKYEIREMISQAYKAVENFPDSISAQKRLQMLLSL